MQTCSYLLTERVKNGDLSLPIFSIASAFLENSRGKASAPGLVRPKWPMQTSRPWLSSLSVSRWKVVGSGIEPGSLIPKPACFPYTEQNKWCTPSPT